MKSVFLMILLLLSLSSCNWRPHSCSYAEQYAYLDGNLPKKDLSFPSPYFLIILVDARQLDYTDARCLLRTMVKHPSDGSKNSDVGHAWIYLQGILNGQCVVLEGGHSGELGVYQPRYFEGIMNYIECGYANPTPLQRRYPQYEPNPIKYLWEDQRDGFFQKGAGKHRPTFGAKINLSETQFIEILRFIETYDFSKFSLVGNQCSTFAARIAELGGISLPHTITLPIPQQMQVGKDCLRLWNDPKYAAITLSSPDMLEKSLIEAVEEGSAEDAIEWYNTHCLPSKCFRCHMKELAETVTQFPSRYRRVLLFR